MKADAVFEGGGMRGIGIVGALNYLESNGYKWVRVAGTSSGALIAALIASGYTAKEIKKIMMETNFNKFLDKNRVQSVPILGKALGFFTDKAMYSGEYLEHWVRKLLAQKGVRKFKDVTYNGECRLKIIASDITRKCSIIFPDDLSNYNIDPMEFDIAKALRMSMSIPIYFKPVKLIYPKGFSYIVDGAITCNFPLNIFDVKENPRWPTLGFKYYLPNSSNTAQGKDDPLSFLFDIASTMSSEASQEWNKPRNIARTIFIPTLGVELTEFNIKREKSIRLYKSGYRSAMNFLKNWDFQQYVTDYRS